jgi:hypothetical protein
MYRPMIDEYGGANSGLDIPNHLTWMVTMWHFGADASIQYKGACQLAEPGQVGPGTRSSRFTIGQSTVSRDLQIIKQEASRS